MDEEEKRKYIDEWMDALFLDGFHDRINDEAECDTGCDATG